MRTLALIRYGFHALRHERPSLYARFCRQLDGLSLRICVANWQLDLAFNRAGHYEPDFMPKADLEVACSEAVLHALAHGKTSFLEALLTDKVHVRGDPESLVFFYEALPLWIVGVMGSQKGEALFEHWSKTIPASGETNRGR